MPGLLAKLRVVDLSAWRPAEGGSAGMADEAAAFAGRILADLGAEVVLPERPGGSPRRTEEPIRFEVHSAGKTPVVVADDHQL
ncbi:MAG: CoA transferase, partial [Mycobacteriales bacterium]